MTKPHSREWYAKLARDLGTYGQPWKRHIDGPDPELIYDALLSNLLGGGMWVLEAGCADGRDAARFGSYAAAWTGYDREEAFIRLAKQQAPQAAFAVWDGQSEVPLMLRGPYDLIVSRRGPTSVIDHLPAVAAPEARFLYVGPALNVPQVPEKLGAIGWQVLGEWRTQVRAWLPTEEADRARSAFLGEPHDPERWEREAEERGRAYWEERLTVLAAAN
ncbi:SAM-dependent methyltransferase [Deinococcus irradiatisoli]|uniref:SAM-dependent methyltransferase n=1 Tax=Deinococcus irradiatisoli TaxID=2202254 RepID=A0A2Z3JGR5_9DEIO|nr:class I SAM-dependent methyltransferase [Deinococcus irradiatisoli]AWN24357.1 SAM-dependent methyltransferase [Deinococcus irradiatisoli]